jgi:probable F420-dependent oxidoreductase
MKFGLNILNFGPGATPESLLRWARFAEERGYHLVMISDHIAVTPDVVQATFPAPFYDPFLALAWIAGQVTQVELGTTVTILPYRHPLQTARLAANLDHLSEGRFILGTGVGWAKQEFKALGVPFEQRGRLANEYLEVIRICWTQEVASYEGQFISFEDVHTRPLPARSGGLPIWVGGSSEAALQRAVRFGDAWHPYRFSLEWLKEEALPRLDQIAETEGKAPPSFCPRLRIHLTEAPLPERERPLGHGNLEQLHTDLAALSNLGAKTILLDTYSGRPEQTLHPEQDWAMLALLAEEVLDLGGQALR